MSNFNILVWYVLPTVLCLIAYIYRTYEEYKRDKNREEELSFYVNKLVWWDIVFRLIVSITPMINIFALLVDAYASGLKNIFDKISSVLDKPVVKNKDKTNQNLDLS